MIRARIVGLSVGLVTPTAGADDGVSLQWDAPPECPGAEAVRAEVKGRSRGVDAPVEAIGVVRSDAGAWVLELTLRGPSGEERRTIRATSCEAIAEAAGLLIAVAADQSVADPVVDDIPEVPPEEPPPPPTEIRVLTSIAPPPRDPEPAAPRRSNARAILRLDVGGQFLRLLPTAAGLGVGGALGAMWPRARVELRGHYYLAATVSYADTPALGGRIDLWTLAPTGCYQPRWRGRPQLAQKLALPLCAGFELGAMRGRSVGVDDPGSAADLFVGIPVDVSVVWSPIPRLGLWLGPQLVVVARRPAFHLRDRERLFQAGPIALRLVAGIELRLP